MKRRREKEVRGIKMSEIKRKYRKIVWNHGTEKTVNRNRQK